MNCEVPLISAINGPAIGLGATIGLLCDVTFIAEDAKIGDNHVRVGITAGDGGALIWPYLNRHPQGQRHADVGPADLG